MSIRKRVTGVTGKPMGDSLSRGLIVAAIQGLLAFGASFGDVLTNDRLLLLLPATTVVGSLLWGAYDRWIRVRLPSA